MSTNVEPRKSAARVIVITLVAIVLAVGGAWGGVMLQQTDAFGWAGGATPVASETPTPEPTPSSTPTPTTPPVTVPATCDEVFTPVYLEKVKYFTLEPLDYDDMGGATSDPVLSQLMLELPHLGCAFDADSFHNFTFVTLADVTPPQAEVVQLRMSDLGIPCEEAFGGTLCTETTTSDEDENFYVTSSVFFREGILLASWDVTTGLHDHIEEAVRTLFGDI